MKKQSFASLPKHAKPREKMHLLGAENMTTTELLAIMLRTGCKNQSVLQVATNLNNKYSLNELVSLSLNEIAATTGIGLTKGSTLMACFEIAKRYKKQISLAALNSPEKVFYQAFEIKDRKQEICQAFYVNGSKQLLQKKTLAVGTINQNFLEFRELLEPAFSLPAAGFFLVHNHPSGNSKPSQQDVAVTKQIAKGCSMVGIELVDHIIVTKNSYFSFKKQGLLE